MTPDPTDEAPVVDTPTPEAAPARRVTVDQVPILGILAVLLALVGWLVLDGEAKAAYRGTMPITGAVIGAWIALLLAGLSIIGQVMVWQLTVRRPHGVL